MGTGPGFSNNDSILRDPFGNPYIITVDVNDDNKCLDGLYRKASVSRKTGNLGHYGLKNNTDASGGSDEFELNASVMIWTAGPNMRYDTGPANEGLNRDNILGW
jgi:hypothetical protein